MTPAAAIAEAVEAEMVAHHRLLEALSELPQELHPVVLRACNTFQAEFRRELRRRVQA